MKISNIIEMLENKVIFLKNQRVMLHSLGDLSGVINLDNEIEETETTLTQLLEL
jgi:hypothetical protein